MKFTLLFPFLILAQLLAAQVFIEAPQSPSLKGVLGSSVAFSDVDGDGDNDVLITGYNSSEEMIAKLYINDGTGSFLEMTDIPFVGVAHGSVNFSDVDGDGDNDVLMTGRTSSGLGRISKLYINDGTGNFSEMTGTLFEGTQNGSVAFSDVDGDGDDDVLISGRLQDERKSKLYINDGTGNFSEMMNTPFEGLDSGSIAFSDIDGDGDNDVLITGDKSHFEPISKLYNNDGAGNFSEMTDTPFENVENGSVAFSDIDRDGDNDLLITGLSDRILPNGHKEKISKLYRNDGAGNFSEITSTHFDGVSSSSVAFSDVDGDGDNDVLITGSNNSFEFSSKLYHNHGNGDFSEMRGHPFANIQSGSVAFSDIDGDGDKDLLISGWGAGNDSGLGSVLYTNEGAISDFTFGINLDFIVYPSPTKSKKLNIEFNSEEHGFVTVKVFNLKGYLLSQQKQYAVIGRQAFPIDIISLSSGSYFVQLDNGKINGSAKFIVQ